ALVLTAFGCFSQRSRSPMQVPGFRGRATAVLPVTPDRVRFVLDVPAASGSTRVAYSEKWVKDYAQVAASANAVLDTLVGEGRDRVVGPMELQRKLEGVCAPGFLNAYLDDPGEFTEAWKRNGLAEIGKKLGIRQLIVVRPRVDIEPLNTGALGTTYTGMAASASYKGTVTVTADLIGLSPPELVQTGSGFSNFWGEWGLVAAGGYGAAIVIPYGFGKGLDRALDQAARTALSELLNAHRGPPLPASKAGRNPNKGLK
ncbi:MAG: hypothetical protein PVG78_07930, partial [Desulfobacterales bacterium]